jgi:hypothetical protein
MLPTMVHGQPLKLYKQVTYYGSRSTFKTLQTRYLLWFTIDLQNSTNTLPTMVHGLPLKLYKHVTYYGSRSTVKTLQTRYLLWFTVDL